MSDAPDKPFYDAARALKRKWTNEPLAALNDSDMAILRPAVAKVMAALEAPTAPPQPQGPQTAGEGGSGATGQPDKPTGLLTAKVALELIGHEAIVQEAYKDSEGIWTWGIGVTSRSGHSVERYKDNPQPIERCIEVYIWLLRNNYIPDVLKAFGLHRLTETQFAAALSFHYNTGAIGKTNWVKLFLAGKSAEARRFLETHYLNGGDLTKRRKAEAALFFDGKWSSDGRAMVYPVRKPSYAPHWSQGKRVDVSAIIEGLLA